MAGKKTIGVLMGYTGDRYHFQIWPTILSLCHENNVNVVFYLGNSIHEPVGYDAQSNVVYGLVNPAMVDGLIVVAGSLCNYITDNEAHEFLARYGDIPIVTIARKVGDNVCVTVENYTGMYLLVSHLIEEHKRKRIAFIRGPEMNPEAQERYRAYCDALEKHGIPLDESLTVFGTFAGPTGATAVAELLDERKVKMDGLVAANDDMLMHARQALLERKVRVPEDVSIGGFDNLIESQYADPPLTTVEQPLGLLGRKATEVLMSIIEGKWDGQKDYQVPSALIVRRSCGCFFETKKPDEGGPREPDRIQTDPETLTNIKSSRQALQVRVVSNARLSADQDKNLVDGIVQMIDAFIEDIESRNDFPGLKALVKTLAGADKSRQHIEKLYTVLFEFQAAFLEYLMANPVIYAYAVRVLLDCNQYLSEQFKNIPSEENRRMWTILWNIKRLSLSLSGTFELDQIKAVLLREMPLLDIGACNITLYDSPVRRTGSSLSLDAPQSRLFFAYNSNREISPDLYAKEFRTNTLVPFDLFTDYTAWCVLPLYFENLHFGFITVEFHPFHSNSIYMIHDIIRENVSWAMKGVLMIKELTDTHQQLVEAAKSAREANFHKSKVLVNMSHELRTPLNTINGITGLLQIGGYEKFEEIMQSLKRLKTALAQIPKKKPVLLELEEEIVKYENLINTFGNKSAYFFEYFRDRVKGGAPESADVVKLLDEIVDCLDEERKEALNAYKHIKEAGIYLLGLIDQVLNLSKVESGKMDVFRTNVIVRQLLDSIRVDTDNYVRSLTKSSSVKIEFEIAPDMPESCYMDKQKVKEVLLNFLSNAIKYTPVGEVTVGVRPDGNWVQFSVKDNGIGIRDEDRPLIFTEFGRTRDSTHIEGTGLGLVLSKKLIEMQEGQVGFDSEYGRGSTFWFRIPLIQKP